jgi:hypothetical protein
MKRILFFGAALIGIFLFPGTAWLIENQEDAASAFGIEKYQYEATPTDHPSSAKELIEIAFISAAETTEYRSRIISSGSSEEISIQMDKNAHFISGVRRFAKGPDSPFREEKIWTNRQAVVVERDKEGGVERKEYRPTPDKELAVDGSLLARLRFFPFDQGIKWHFFMIDFSGYSISVTVHQEGSEKIVVPAGEFECYRMVISVNIPLLRPEIIYWLSIQKPNYLVKHQGKRGPFSPSYTTSLVSIQ